MVTLMNNARKKLIHTNEFSRRLSSPIMSMMSEICWSFTWQLAELVCLWNWSNCSNVLLLVMWHHRSNENVLTADDNYTAIEIDENEKSRREKTTKKRGTFWFFVCLLPTTKRHIFFGHSLKIFNMFRMYKMNLTKCSVDWNASKIKNKRSLFLRLFLIWNIFGCVKFHCGFVVIQKERKPLNNY